MNYLSVTRSREGSATAFQKVEPIRLLIDSINEDWARLAAILCYWGCGRANAVLNLKAQDLRGGKILYRTAFNKDNRSHTAPIFPSLAAALEEFELPESGHLFPTTPRGGRTEFRQHWVPESDVNEALEKGWTQGRQKKYSRAEKVYYMRFTEKLDKKASGVRSVGGFDNAVKRAASRLIEAGHDEYYGVSSHTFRRSMCSYLYFTMGWTLAEVRKISGHRSVASLTHYLQVDEAELGNKIAMI